MRRLLPGRRFLFEGISLSPLALYLAGGAVITAKAMLRNTESAYGLPAIALHWSIALLFFGQVALGLIMDRVSAMALQFTLIQWHKSLGFLILLLSLLRLVWRLANRAPAVPATMGSTERLAARSVQALLYILLILVPLAGWALVSTSTLNIPSFAFNVVVVPDLPLARTDAAEAFWRQAHTLLAYAAAIVATGHVLAALRHQFWLRDGVLRRMMFPASRPANSRRTSP